MNAQARDDLDLLSAKLRRIQGGYEWARSRGDAERISQFRMQLNAIADERNCLIKHVSDKATLVSRSAQ
jgi:hypothetical protein